MHGIVLLNKTYSWHTLCWTKPIPSIGYVRQNLFLAYVMLDKTTYGTLLQKFVKQDVFQVKK